MEPKKQPITDMKPQDLLKSFVSQVGALIDARMGTFETVIRGEMKALRGEIRSVETGLHGDIQAVKTELQKDIARVEQKIDKLDYEERISHLETRVKELEAKLASVSVVVKSK